MINNQHKLLSLALTFACVVAANLFFVATCTAEAAADVVINANGTVSPEVQQALDSVYIAAKEAGMINASVETKISADTTHGDSTGGQAQKSTRDPLSQMVAFGLGAGAGMLIVNYLGGSATIGSFNAFSAITFGGMMGDYVYRKHYAPPLPSIPAGIANRVSP